MAIDFRVKTFFTPNFTLGFSDGQAWYDAYRLASLNLGGGFDTVPEPYQYVYDNDYDSGLRPNFPYIEVTNTFNQGSRALIKYDAYSDRDIFEIADNEHTTGGVHDGHMMPRLNFIKKYRAWQINLKGKDDANFPSPAMFHGMLVKTVPQPITDRKLSGRQDWNYLFSLFFESFDTWNLRNDKGAAIWHHRANATTDTYHESFRKNHHITFDDAITRVVAWMNVGRPGFDFPVTYSYTPKNVSPYNIYLDADTLAAPYDDVDIIDTGTRASLEILAGLLDYMGALEGAGLKYVPTLTVNAAGTTGTIDTALGGYDKNHAVDEDFRSTQGIQKNTSTDMPIRFNMISVPFTAIDGVTSKNNDNEYWIKFLLYKWNGSGWDTVLTIPASGYEYVPFDPLNVHARKYYNFATQETTPEDTYKWDTDLVTSGSFIIGNVGASAFSPPVYSLPKSGSETDFTKLRTFVFTRGMCDTVNTFHTTLRPAGCHDGGLIADGGNQKCYDDTYPLGCYPDPHAQAARALTGTITTALGTAVTGSGTAFLTELEPNWQIKRDAAGTWGTVKSIQSDTALTLVANYGSAGSGVGTLKEGVSGTYGIIGKDKVNFADISNLNNWNTRCRINSRRIYQCALNTGSRVREPVDATLVFPDGWTTNLIGAYLEYYEPVVDDMVIIRCTEQKHILTDARLETTLGGFRV